jgi:HK97 family phage prohead protease
MIVVRGYASTPIRDRTGEAILTSSFEDLLHAFAKSPKIYANHRKDKLVGKATSLLLTCSGLLVEVQVSDPETVEDVKSSKLAAFSIGFSRLAKYLEGDETTVTTRVILREVSLVDHPAGVNTKFAIVETGLVDITREDFRATVYWSEDKIDHDARTLLYGSLDQESYPEAVRRLEKLTKMAAPGIEWAHNCPLRLLERRIEEMTLERDKHWAQLLFSLPLETG